MKSTNSFISIRNANENNLKGISLDLPHKQLIVVTGVSGSGKSSLAFDTIAHEGKRRYFETLPAFSRQFVGKLSQPKVDKITGLSPVIAVSQNVRSGNTRSSVGTLTELTNWIRLLFARKGVSSEYPEIVPNRSLFSSNSKIGMCPRCKGLGIEEQIDPEKLVLDPSKTLREGVLAPTLPTGYIMYSQVTLEVLNLVCKSEGFSIDIPWNQLSGHQKNIIFYGTDKIKVPFGKHSLESRLKWTGMKAKPREEGFYKGLITIMTDILKRDRNPNILKYVSAVQCPDCNGEKLNTIARSFRYKNQSIATVSNLTIKELHQWASLLNKDKTVELIRTEILKICSQLIDFGLGYLYLNQPSKTCTLSQLQRMQIANQLHNGLSDVLYVFDEPSIGLNQSENQVMILALKRLVKQGNTVLVVEHDLDTIKAADWIVEIGPKAGKNGGELVFNGSKADFIETVNPENSFTWQSLNGKLNFPEKEASKISQWISIKNTSDFLQQHKWNNFQFAVSHLTVVSSENGKLRAAFGQSILSQLEEVVKKENLGAIVRINQNPIGKTPRSNPATYLGISDSIRDLFAKQSKAKEKGQKKSHFSFNTKGGRCETCLGAGKIVVGLHYLGKVETTCETCGGKRFNANSLAILYKKKTIADIYELSVKSAISFFSDQPKILKSLEILDQIGLGYLKLGQSSTKLSGGEAQRIKIANELQQKNKQKNIYVLNEPSIGLHPYDIINLLRLFQTITKNGHTIICLDEDEKIRQFADHSIHLAENKTQALLVQASESSHPINSITLKGVNTNSLKNVTVQLPKNKLTLITGRSGSGKSSLVYDTLYAESHSRFSSSFSTYNRGLIKLQNQSKIDHADGLTPTLSLRQQQSTTSIRSTIGTATEIHSHLRLLYSRIAQKQGFDYTAQHFSFNHKLGACNTCNGLGTIQEADPLQLIADPNKSILSGGLTTHKAIKYYTNLEGQFIATLKCIAATEKMNLNIPWNQLPKTHQNIILNGTGNRIWEVTWDFKTKTRQGTQQIKTEWKGFLDYINEEFELKKDSKNSVGIRELLRAVTCTRCKGRRLKKEFLEITFQSKNIHQVCEMELNDFNQLFQSTQLDKINPFALPIITLIQSISTPLIQLGLGYLNLNRSTKTLSGGELQRVRIAGRISAKLYGCTYVLDEPTIGLAPAQIEILYDLCRKLVEQGNTVVIIEHDRFMLNKADHIIEMGPGSGQNGGKIIAQGTYKDLIKHPKSIIHFKPSFRVPTIDTARSANFGVKKAYINNLKDIDIVFIRNHINAIKGVSGSGKSSLLTQVIYPSAKSSSPIGCAAFFGFDHFETVLLVDQKPLSLGKTSTVASFTGLIDQLKKVYSKHEMAKKNGFKSAHFSYLDKKGRCEHCSGLGEEHSALDFIGDLYIPCPVCKGKRYNVAVNSFKINWKEKELSVADVLQITIAELIKINEHKTIEKILLTLEKTGLSHLKIGQSTTTLSGGELQRLKLFKALSEQRTNSLYLFDEPSNGLHDVDLDQIIHTFNTLIEHNNTVIFVEHNEFLLRAAHYWVELGPESGKNGGEIIRSS